jgi:hypothetical protein
MDRSSFSASYAAIQFRSCLSPFQRTSVKRDEARQRSHLTEPVTWGKNEPILQFFALRDRWLTSFG